MLEQKYPTLAHVNSPDTLKKLNVHSLRTLAREIRAYMIETVSQTGGHLSSSLGAIELAIALHTVFQTPDDKIIWDVGHQAYAHKILTGRRDRMLTMRQHHGLVGFPNREESEYDAFGTGHSSTSISAALGMAVAANLEGNHDRWHIAVIGDGALTGGMALEALNDAGVWKNGLKLLIILNDNDCSISPAVGALSSHLAKIVSNRAYLGAREFSKKMLKPLPALWNVAKRMEKQAINMVSESSGIFSAYDINYYGPVDGHNLRELLSVLGNLRNADGPCVLHVVTQKGHGYQRAEADPTTYHGVGRFDPTVGIVSSGKKSTPTYTEVFGRWLCDTARVDKRLYGITPAMREGSGLVEFAERFPDRYRDVAIAEQHAVTYAAGLACTSIRPVVAIYSSFLQRAIDQVIHDVALQNLPVLFAVDRGGLVGADGATHHGVFDISLLRCIPNMLVMTPSDENECRLMLNTGYRYEGPASVRYPRGKGPGVAVTASTRDTIPLGKARKMRDGSKIAFLGFGRMTYRLDKVAQRMNGSLWDMRFVKPIDREAIVEAAQTHDLLVIAEEGVKMGGACSAVLEVLAEEGICKPVMTFAIEDRFIEQGTQEELWDEVGLTAEKIARAVKARIKSLS